MKKYFIKKFKKQQGRKVGELSLSITKTMEWISAYHFQADQTNQMIMDELVQQQYSTCSECKLVTFTCTDDDSIYVSKEPWCNQCSCEVFCNQKNYISCEKCSYKFFYKVSFEHQTTQCQCCNAYICLTCKQYGNLFNQSTNYDQLIQCQNYRQSNRQFIIQFVIVAFFYFFYLLIIEPFRNLYQNLININTLTLVLLNLDILDSCRRNILYAISLPFQLIISLILMVVTLIPYLIMRFVRNVKQVYIQQNDL